MIYFPKDFAWLNLDESSLTRNIQEAKLYETDQAAKAYLSSSSYSEALVQRYKAALVITENTWWRR